MITVLPEKDEKTVNELFLKSNIENKSGECVTARYGEEVLGYCLFTIRNGVIFIHDIVPHDDIMLADGVLRSALHVASERFVFKAKYDNRNLEEILTKLKFIKEAGTDEIDIDKLFRGCGH